MKEFGSEWKDKNLKDDDLNAFVLFSDLQLAGHDPDPDEFLARYPGHSLELRAAVEGAKLVNDAARRKEAEQPGVSLAGLMRGLMRR